MLRKTYRANEMSRNSHVRFGQISRRRSSLTEFNNGARNRIRSSLRRNSINLNKLWANIGVFFNYKLKEFFTNHEAFYNWWSAPKSNIFFKTDSLCWNSLTLLVSYHRKFWNYKESSTFFSFLIIAMAKKGELLVIVNSVIY